MRTSRTTGSVGAVALSALLLLSQGCTDLSEHPTSLITPDNFYQTEEEVMGGLASIYSGLRATLWGYYNLSEVSTDEMIVPTRGSDWYDGGRWLEMHYQTWAPNNSSGQDINGAWNDAFGAVARANVLLEVLPNIAVANKEVVEAEVRTLRAFYYYVLMDLFGGVPVVETTEIMPREAASRAEVFAFIESELQATRGVLPAVWPASMHGRMTSGAANAILASLYLNAEVFTGTVSATGLQRGTARWQDAIDAADAILNSGEYALADDFGDNFAPDNHLSPEHILVIKNVAQSGFGFDNHFFYRAMHYNSGIGGGWNGFSTLAETYYAFDTASVETLTVPGTSQQADILHSNDLRHDIFLAGQHYNVETGEAVNDRANLPLFFTPEILNETQAHEREGVRIYKWPVDPAREGNTHGNDYAIFRLAEIYLIKAEAMNELAQTPGAIALLNLVRERAFDPDRPIPTTLSQAEARDRIQRERLFELTAEGKRRQDLIRWDRFTDPWTHKDQREPYRILMPIPQTQRDANPLLKQNPGY
ncbi:MAG TPA: RagB/SusD family nutrient uptake outer membrane protein [Longimicrobiales bacterium]|nr:RagB/SusD family nutrient uptake outer membrane protein [Longimicrobiales bacterium]